MKNHIKDVEAYAKKLLTKIAHDFKHVDRVRHNIIVIAKKENYPNLKMAEIAALLHDIGLSKVRKARNHGRVGAKLAKAFLLKEKLLADKEIDEICYAIKNHNTKEKLPGTLLALLRDADMLDAMGIIGVMRAFTSKYYLPDYDPENIKGETWGFNNIDFDKRFQKGLGAGKTIIDEINFQISFFDNLNTRTAKILAKPLIRVSKNFILKLEKAIG